MNPKNIYSNEQRIPSWCLPVGMTVATFAFSFGLSGFGNLIANSPLSTPINTILETAPNAIGKAASESDGFYLVD